MEVVRTFNNELSSLYEAKPPISKAKMTQVTKTAIKGIKFYKHIVQSVEKFIQKCRPEYKIPGLYVVDSIVRQSRHQFGADKDVFGPRFLKNLSTTFQHLFKCADEDRSKIVRVLNLWQKNAVFPSEVTQTLMDMANPNTSTEWAMEDPAVAVNESPAKINEEAPNSRHKAVDPAWKNWLQANDEVPPDNRTYAEMSTKNLEKFTKGEASSLFDNDLLKTHSKADVKPIEENAVKFNKKLLDFDYGDEEDEEEAKHEDLSNQPNALALSVAQNLLSNPELLRQLQQMQQNEALKSELDETKAAYSSPAVLPAHPFGEGMLPYQFEKIPFPSQQPPLPDFPPELLPNTDEDERMYSMPGEPPLPPHDFDERLDRKDRSRSRSRGRSGRHRSRSKSPRRKRSRSRSHSRRNRSRSRERQRERRRKGLPPVKKGCISVCSTTIWLGHVPKSCSEADISSVFGQYGTILSIDMIPPRGCAYVVMDRRRDGYRALQKLKDSKIQGSSIKMAWAPGKGVKGKEYKDYWEVELGVSYVPLEKVPANADALDFIEEGGFIDDESLPEQLKVLRQNKEAMRAEGNLAFGGGLPPNMVPPPLMPPNSVGLPMVMPHFMQPQLGLHLPGLLPPQAMVMPVPMGIPPPNPVLMVQQQSQNMQPLQMMPPMVSRVALPNLKASEAAGDATPTDEDGTSSPKKFNSMMGLRPMLSVPPPVSSAGTPIPYPPPNVGFGFPPPGMRPPMGQFQWMQKGNAVRPVYGNRPFEAPADSKPEEKKEENKRSPMRQEMVISTDDESSMDQDYARGGDPRFQGPLDFGRVDWMQGPPRFPSHPGYRMNGPRGMRMEFGRRMRAPPRRGDGYVDPQEFDPPYQEPWRHDDYHRGRATPDATKEAEPPAEEKKEYPSPKPKPSNKTKNVMGDLFRLKFYKRESNKPVHRKIQKGDATKRPTQEAVIPEPEVPKAEDPTASDRRPMDTIVPPMDTAAPPSDTSLPDKPSCEETTQNGQPQKMDPSVCNSRRDRDRDSRKRSRWGRTLSEEREFQQQKRNEIEIKFQSYELSHSAQLPADLVNADVPPAAVGEPLAQTESSESILNVEPVLHNSEPVSLTEKPIIQNELSVGNDTQLIDTEPIPLSDTEPILSNTEPEPSHTERLPNENVPVLNIMELERSGTVLNNVELENSGTVLNNMESERSDTVLNNVELENSGTVLNNMESERSGTVLNSVASERSDTVLNNVESERSGTVLNNVELESSTVLNDVEFKDSELVQIQVGMVPNNAETLFVEKPIIQNETSLSVHNELSDTQDTTACTDGSTTDQTAESSVASESIPISSES